jgi:hypothetical protein
MLRSYAYGLAVRGLRYGLIPGKIWMAWEIVVRRSLVVCWMTYTSWPFRNNRKAVSGTCLEIS